MNFLHSLVALEKKNNIGQFVLRLLRGLDKVALSVGHISLRSFNALERTNHIMPRS